MKTTTRIERILEAQVVMQRKVADVCAEIREVNARAEKTIAEAKAEYNAVLEREEAEAFRDLDGKYSGGAYESASQVKVEGLDDEGN